MIFETIVTTADINGMPHVAPFGVQYDAQNIIISPYKPSTTLDNILATQCAVLNITDDVRVFAGALTNRQAWTLVPSTKIQGYRLASCLAHAELQLIDVRDDDLRPQLIMQKILSVNHQAFAGFNRAQAAVIELAVLVSRLNRLPKEKVMADLTYLQIAIDKTAGDNEREAWLWLQEKINDFYTNNTKKLFKNTP